MGVEPGRLDPVMVIGIGNPYRRDDAAGRAVVQGLAGRVPVQVMLREHDGEGTSLMDAWQGAELVIITDAVASGAAPGSIVRFDAHTGPVPATAVRDSTHAVGLPEAVELARALGRLPHRLIVYGIAGAAFDAGEGLSPAVEQAVEDVAVRVLQDIAAAAGEERCTSSR